MSKIKFHRLSMREAEEVVVEIWKCLEEYGFPVPHLIFDFHDAATVSIALEVEEPVSAVIMNWRMSSWLDACSCGADSAQDYEETAVRPGPSACRATDAASGNVRGRRSDLSALTQGQGA